MPLIFELTDLSAHDTDPKNFILGLARENTARKFDLAKGPLVAAVSTLNFIVCSYLEL
jgi:hypothetical protein